MKGITLLSTGRTCVMVVGLFALLLVAYHLIYAPFFPIDGYRLGHDYAAVFPNWLDGRYWFANNGLEPPWFSPSFCAGQPFFADPQSAFYALPQMITLVSDPLTAAYSSLLICASLMFWGGYILMRRVFLTSPATACLVGGLLMFNGFLPHRMIAGHTSYQAFSLVPWVALALLIPIEGRLAKATAGVVAGVLIAYWVQSGLGTLIVAAALAVLVIALVAAMRGASMRSFVTRSMLASIVGLGLSASKLVAAMSLLSQLPRDFYPLPGAATIADTLVMLLACLFLPSQAAQQIGVPRLANLMWAAAPHEWAYGFGMAAAVLAVLLLYSLARNRAFKLPSGGRQWLLFSAIIVVLAWPLAFSTWQADWNAFLKSLPLLGSTSFPLRWFIVYIPFTAICLGLLLESQLRGRARTLAALACLAGTVILSAIEPRGYYEQQGYDIRPIMIANEYARSHPGEARIGQLGTEASLQVGDNQTNLGSNDTLIVGMSQVYCYNPIFGYRLEKFSAEGLESGDVLKETDGYLNLKNPACYVFPKENGCSPGDRFRSDQFEQARAFAGYRPFAFRTSRLQDYASIATLATLVGTAVILCAWLVWSGCLLVRWLKMRRSS